MIFGIGEACVGVLGLSLIETFNLSDPVFFFIYKIERKMCNSQICCED